MKGLDTPTYSHSDGLNKHAFPFSTNVTEDTYQEKQIEDTQPTDLIIEKKVDMTIVMGVEKLFMIMKNLIRKRFQWVIKAI